MWCPNQECADAVENGVPGEFREGIIACPICGAGLVSYLPDWASPPPDENVEWVYCLTVGDVSLLPQMRAMLDSAGVQYFVKDEGVQHLVGLGTVALGFNPLTGPPVLMVATGDLERAIEALGELKEAIQNGPGTAPPAPVASSQQTPSSCIKCGKALEMSEGDDPLTACYHCGWPLGSV